MSNEPVNAMFTVKAAISSSELSTLLELIADCIGDRGQVTLVYNTSSDDLDSPIETLLISQRPLNGLKRANIHTVGQLLEKRPHELLEITNFGMVCLSEVVQRLATHGLALKEAERQL